MLYDNNIWIGQSETDSLFLSLKMANRHGLIAGATGTGKTTTLKVLAESFSKAGVPVFTADIKGDLTGTIEKGKDNDIILERKRNWSLVERGYTFEGYPCTFWDVFQENGHPVRATISEMGPILLANILELSDAQRGVLDIAFQVADDNNLLLLDLKDLKAMLNYVSDNASELKSDYGHITSQSVGAVIRSLLSLEKDGADLFFGEPSLDINDWLQCDSNGYGYINILECSKLFLKPKLYATFMLWMLSELYETLPEVGDLDKPKAVFFFDEAHLLFDDAPKALVSKIEQVIRLIRSKGIGIYFVTQNPIDIPDSILGQLGNRIQHALRAYTPNEIKNVKAASDTFRANPNFDTQDVIMNLGVGEALVSFIDERGIPSVVEKCMILPPESSMEAINPSIIKQIVNNAQYASKYNVSVNRESAFEILDQKRQELEEMKADQLKAEQEAKQRKLDEIEAQKRAKEEEKLLAKQEKEREKELAKKEKEEERKRRKTEATITSLQRTAINTIGREVTRQFTRSILGVFKK